MTAPERLALGAVIAAGFALRIAGLQDIGFSPDEAQFIYIAASDSWDSAWHSIVKRSPHPPANFALLHALLKLSWDPLWLRLPSVLAGTFLVWLAHRFGRSLFGPVAGFAFAVLVAFSPALLELSRVCRNYAPGFAFLLPAIHCLVRHVETRSRRPLAVFAVLAPLAGIWHYGFVVVFVALDTVVAIEFLLQRRPLRDWLAVAVAHLPFVLTLGALYRFHISQMPDRLVGMHQTTYASSLGLSMLDSLAPFQQVWRYLELDPFAAILGVLSLAGAVGLLLRRRRLAFLVCVLPPAVALGFSAFGLIPFGGTRHSAYLFPFLFGPVAFAIGELAAGFRAAPGDAARASGASREIAVWGAATAVLLGLWFAGTTCADRLTEKRYAPLTPDGMRNELPVWYRVADVEAGFALLEREVGENDLVLLEFQGLYALRMHHHLTPPAKKRSRLSGLSRRVRTFELNGVAYHYSHEARVLTPEVLLRLADRVIGARRLAEPQRIWAVQGSWEFPLAEQMRRRFPRVPFDESVERESGGTVFAIDSADLRAALPGPRAAAREPGRRGRPER